MEIKLIANRIALHPEQLEYVFEHICNDYRDSFCVDWNRNTPALYRKNLFEKITLEGIKIKKKKKKTKSVSFSDDEDGVIT